MQNCPERASTRPATLIGTPAATRAEAPIHDTDPPRRPPEATCLTANEIRQIVLDILG